MISKWNYLPLTSEEQELEIELAKKFAGSPAIAELLVQRGITSVAEAERFFNPSLSDLHDPFLMRDMDKAVNRLNKAMGAKEKILVYGDYDVDGTTAVALVYKYLRNYYSHIEYYIPMRDEEGYGISFKSIDYAVSIGVKLIIVLDCGIKAIDEIAYAKEKGIPVCNVPNYGGYSVSQFAIALMLEACLHIGHHNQTVHDGKWQNGNEWCYWDYPLIELAGKTYGLLGCGKIGYHTAEAAKGLGMHVIAYDKYPSQAARDLGVEFVELDDLFARSDVLGLQMPLMEFNTGIIRKENIAKMKDGVIIINNSRGQMVVEQDLADALNSGKVAFAGLDVVSTEPIRADNPLLKAKNCIITPHMSWGSQGSRQRIMDTTAENVKAFLAGSPVNVVNR